MINPENLLRANSEDSHQTAVFCRCAMPDFVEKYPQVVSMYAIPNGGHRSKTQAAILKRTGVKAGMPDMHLPVAKYNYRNVDGYTIKVVEFLSLYIELKLPKYKTRKNGGCSDAQLAKHIELRALGHKVVVAYGYDQVIMTIEEYLG